MKPKKQLLFVFVLVAIGIVVAFATVELVLRTWSNIKTPEEAERALRLKYIPALFARHVLAREERVVPCRNDVLVHISERGYRGEAFPHKKAPRSVRIMIYGGSAVFDDVSGMGQDWPHQIQQTLRANGLPQVEVINAGVPGHATFDSFGRLFASDHLYEPDYVLLYHGWNDIKYFGKHAPLMEQFKPYSPTGDPRLYYRNAFDRFCCRRSRLFCALRLRFYNSRLAVGPEGALRPDEPYAMELSPESLKQFRLNVEMFVAAASAIGAKPVLITQARLVRLTNDDAAKQRIIYDYVKLSHEKLCEAFEETDRVLNEIARKHGIGLIDVSSVLTGRDELFRDHVHLSENGSAAVAQVVADGLRKILAADGISAADLPVSGASDGASDQ